ncbi:carotenoid oxygenase family protein [Thalassotalea sp. 1_MG-2023]|uniref:carotenoid oxygenase family protein n=1 Tax=Thalassotalea sp. 1_MG-2023 TaxID=3062680 RepID=UPI0026E2F3BA|nr:carotenoid oxygenase family protein [Thalassotalea sp. 1_MG-2023]MDO6428867.1 carotenoid oxygenase family protein [Thalassotalea sp. 1_MG-2023]
MERRQALKSLVVGAATTMLPATESLAAFLQQETDSLAENKVLFDKALLNNPNLIGFQGTHQEFSKTRLTIEGTIPKNIKGSFYRNGAALFERGQQRYQHLFEGDGMIQDFHFENGEIYHQGKFVKTRKYQQEQQAGKFLYSGPDSKVINGLPVSTPEAINTANTNIIPVNGELWALWEAGSPVSISKKDLSTLEYVNLGRNSDYGNTLKGMAFSAHPKIEANGDIWNFGLSHTGHIVLYQLNANGVTRNVNLIKTSYRGGMLHDFLITHKHILLILPSLEKNNTTSGFFNAIEFNDQLPMQVLVVDKATLALKKRFDLPPGFAFHYGNAWEESDGSIHFDASLYSSVDVLHHMNTLMKGLNPTSLSTAKTTLFTLKPNGTVQHDYIGENSEFPRINNEKVGLRNHELYTIGSTETMLWNDTVSNYHISNGKIQQYVYGKDFLVEEHIAVSPTNKEGEGYLIGTALHVPSKRTCLNIFDVKALSNGPVCRAWLPYHIPLGFHGNFVATT